MTASATPPPTAATPLRLGLGVDAGGTQTRWAVADGVGRVVAEGTAAPLSGLQLHDSAGCAQIDRVLLDIASQTGAVAGAVGAALVAITGLSDAHRPLLCARAAAACGLPTSAVQAVSDIELACRAAFEPGQGHVLYAGTGTIAACIDGNGSLQRAGGRGAVIDDAGGGHWIARQALRQIWRGEDAAPGRWAASPMAVQVFKRIGGSDWAQTRAWVHGAGRGELGTLAVAVAAAADADPAALAILQQAGRELARLALALRQRLGPRPIALAGRVFTLHPAIEQALRAALPADCDIHHLTVALHHAAARLAANEAARAATPTIDRTTR